MNLTDTDQTPITRVFDAVSREAGRYGVAVASSEVIGLVPQKALDQAAVPLLKIENFNPSMILENRLAAALACHRQKSS